MAPSEEANGTSNKIMFSLAVSMVVLMFSMFLLRLYALYVLCQPKENRSAIGAWFALALSEEPERETSNIGLDPSVITALPLFVYCVRESGQGNKYESALECSICVSLFNASNRVGILPNCRHCFHAECIDKWLGLMRWFSYDHDSIFFVPWRDIGPCAFFQNKTERRQS